MKKNVIEDVSGDYQFNALHKGPISQRLWHKQKLEVIKNCLQGKGYKNICDAGCGSGVVTDYAAAILPDANLTGYDINERSIAFASEKFKKHNLHFHLKNLVEQEGGDREQFDFVYSMEVIEHFYPHEIRKYLASLEHIGRKNTRYCITTPDYLSFWPLIEWSMDRLKLTPKMAQHQHLTKFSKSTLSTTLEESGFEVLAIYNFCGMCPFFAHLSLRLSAGIDKIEKSLGYGNLICCEFRKKP